MLDTIQIHMNAQAVYIKIQSLRHVGHIVIPLAKEKVCHTV